MNENIRVENWCGHDIRFVEHEGSWYAVLKDICDALGLRTNNTKLRIDELHLIKTSIPQQVVISNQWTTTIPQSSSKNYDMLCVDEAGIYQALSRSTRLEARKFIDWISHSLVDLRKAIGLEGYEALRLTESTIQEAISKKIDIPYAEPTGDIIPVKTEPTVVNNITNVTTTVDYRKVFGYAAAGCACGIAIYCGVKYVVKKVKAKKAKKN